MKLAVAGTGYVGLSNGILLAQNNEMVRLDILLDGVAVPNQMRPPVDDPDVKDYLVNKKLSFHATLGKREAYVGKEFFIIATPTWQPPELLNASGKFRCCRTWTGKSVRGLSLAMIDGMEKVEKI